MEDEMESKPKVREAPVPAAPASNVEPNPPARSSPWARATMWIVITALITGSGVYVFKETRDLPGQALDRAGRTFEAAGTAMANVAAAFNQGVVTTSFMSFATSLHPSLSLQFATLKQTELFTHTEERATGFGYIPLPRVIVEARAPVEYTYFLDLNAKWDFFLKDDVLYVSAPPVQFNKPSVDASRITYETRKGGVLREPKEALGNLKQMITSLSKLRAKENIPLVRETARRQTELFVSQWLAKSFADGHRFQVQVYFPKEQAPLAASETAAAGPNPILK